MNERAPAGAVDRSEFSVPKMDCPSEERTIRMALDGLSSVHSLEFDLPGRRLTVWHAPGVARTVGARLESLGFGARLVETRSDDAPPSAAAPDEAQDSNERRTLWVLLSINAAMFVAEVVAGWLAESAGLLADSLDMLADAMVYGLGLYAVGKAATHKLRAAHVSGWFQLALAFGALFEVVRRFLGGSEPEPLWMIAVAAVALVANVTCLVLVARHRHGGAHMKASYIFSTNDVIANCGVMVAGGLVAGTGSRLPDLVVGTIIGAVVFSGAVRILRIR
jgi:Co/Zn/Cd efflux system component